MRRPLRASVLALVAVAAALTWAGCSTSHPRRNPIGEPFPRVTGSTLDGTEVRLPDIGHGQPLLLLLGYEQDAQFDIDRWLLGLDQAGTDVRVLEVPTIAGMVPRMISGTIDGGMRRGIPEEDWGSVVTVYGDASELQRFTGSQDGLTGRVVLLDAKGRVAFFHDRGYSVRTLRRLERVLAGMRPPSVPAPLGR